MNIVRYPFMPNPIQMPRGAVVIGVGRENGILTLFVEQGTEYPSVSRTFTVTEVGNPIPASNPPAVFVGMVQTSTTFLFVHEVFKADA